MSRESLPPTDVGSEDGRRGVAQERDGYWTMDPHGGERFVEAEVPAAVSRAWSPLGAGGPR